METLSSAGRSKSAAQRLTRSKPSEGDLVRDGAAHCYVQDASVTDVVRSMTKKTAEGVSRVTGVAHLILTSLADGEKHGYALTQDVMQFSGIRIAPGSLYEALARLEGQGLIEPITSTDRRRPYRLTAAGAAVLDEFLSAQEQLASEGRRRLCASWRFS